MANDHQLDDPRIATKDDKLIVTVTFHGGGWLAGKLRCTLVVVHAALLAENDEQVFNEFESMKVVDGTKDVFEAVFEIEHAKIGKVAMDITVGTPHNGRTLAQGSFKLGPKLNTAVRMQRRDAAPRILQGLNTAIGPEQKPSTKHKLNDILEHIHAALVDNDGFRAGIRNSIDTSMSTRRQASKNKLTRVDEELTMILTEKLLGLPYQMAGNVYGNCYVKNEQGKQRLVHLNNDVFWELMRPSASEITYPWCSECQQLTTMVNYLRGVDVYALAPGNKGEFAAQEASFGIAKQAGGSSIEDIDLVNGKLPKSLYEDEPTHPDHPHAPLGPGDFFVFNKAGYLVLTEVEVVDKQTKQKTKVKKDTVVTEKQLEEMQKDMNEQQKKELNPRKLSAQDHRNSPHISCIIRTFKRAGNHFFQLMDTGGVPGNPEGIALLKCKTPVAEGICDGRFISQVKTDGSVAAGAHCRGIGIFPKSHKQDVGKLEKALKRARVARPVALARLFLFERETKAVLYATPLLRTYGDDAEENYPPARLCWSLRNLPHRGEIGAFWAIWGPRGPLARRLIDSRQASLFDVRSEFASSTAPSPEFGNVVLSKFPYAEGSGFLFLENIVAMGPDQADELHADSKHTYRFPIDDADPDHYKQFGYVEITKLNHALRPASQVQDKRYDLNKYAWDQHVFGDRSVREVKAETTSTEAEQELPVVDGQLEIDPDLVGSITGTWVRKGPKEFSPVFASGKVGTTPGAPSQIVVAAGEADKTQSLVFTLPKSATTGLSPDGQRLLITLQAGILDKRYDRPDKFDSYPHFRGDFPMKPKNCPGNPTPDECDTFKQFLCPPSCQYIVKLRGFQVSGGALRKQGDVYAGSVSFTAGASLTVTTRASCKASVQVRHGGSTVTTTTGEASPPLNLQVGKNTIEVEATGLNAQSDVATLEIEREAPSSVQTLSELKVSAGKLAQVTDPDAGFVPEVQAYDLVGTNAAFVQFTPKLTSEDATMKVDGETKPDGKPFAKTFSSFGLHELTIDVRAQDGSTGTYSIAYRRGNADNHLSKLQVLIGWTQQKVVKQVSTEAEQAEHPSKETYTVEVPDDTHEVKIVATPRFGGAKVFLNGTKMSWQAKLELDDDDVQGDKALNASSPTIALIEVEAQNGLRRLYELRILRPKDEPDVEGEVDDSWLE